MCGRDRDVERIDGGSLWHGPKAEQFFSEVRRRLAEGQTRNPAERAQPLRTGIAISESGLISNDLRRKQAVLMSSSPPAPCQCLMTGDDDIAARARPQVTDDAGFDIDAGKHVIHMPHVIHEWTSLFPSSGKRSAEPCDDVGSVAY